MPINTAPDFWGGLGQKLRQGMPGMMNTMAQNYGDPRLRGAAQMTGLIGAQRKRPLPSKKTGMSKGDIGYKPPVSPRRPDMPQQTPVDPRNTTMPIQMPMMQNTGWSGMGMPGGINPGMPEMGGLWNTYNRLLGMSNSDTGTNMGRLFY